MIYMNEDDQIVDIEYTSKRNDNWINSYIPETLFVWRANIDASPCLHPYKILE